MQFLYQGVRASLKNCYFLSILIFSSVEIFFEKENYVFKEQIKPTVA